MPDISQDLQKILDARYGEDVRGAIHDSIEDINDVCESYKGDAETARDQAVASANSANTAKQYCETLAQQFDKAFIYIGTVTWAEFLALTNVHTGYTWNISEEFTTTADFKEGTGHEYPAGTNVVRTNDNMWDVLTGISEGSGIKKITAAEFLANEAYYRGSGKTYWISDGQNYILNAQAMAFTPTTQISSTNVQSAIEEVSNSLAEKIKIKTVSGTTDGYGKISLGLDRTEYILINVYETSGSGLLATSMFHSSTNNYYAQIRGWNNTYSSSSSVTLEVVYCER